MKAIKKFSISRLRHEEAFRFFNRAVGEMQTALRDATDNSLPDAVTAFQAAVSTLDGALEKDRGSIYTATLQAADAAADAAFAAARDYVRAWTRCQHDADAKAAAERIAKIFDRYGNIVDRNYQEEYGAYRNLLQDLNTAREDTVAIGLTKWITQMQTAATAFDTAQTARTAELAARIAGEVKAARTAATEAYATATAYVNGLYATGNTTTTATLIDNLNQIIDEFALLLTKRTPTDATA